MSKPKSDHIDYRYCQNAQCPHRQHKRFTIEQLVKVGEMFFCPDCVVVIIEPPLPY